MSGNVAEQQTRGGKEGAESAGAHFHRPPPVHASQPAAKVFAWSKGGRAANAAHQKSTKISSSTALDSGSSSSSLDSESSYRS